MREAVELAPGAAAEDRRFEAVVGRGGGHRRPDVERGCAVGGDRTNRIDVGVDTACDRRQVVGAELVAARTDRRPEDDLGDGMGELSCGDVDDSGSEPTPAGVNDSEFIATDHHERSTIGDPAPEHDVGEIGDHDVTGASVASTGNIDTHHVDAVTLIGHRPREIDPGTAAALELAGRLAVQVEVTVAPRGTADGDRAVAT